MTLIALGAFHATLGVRFSRLDDWWNTRPIWLRVVTLPVVVVLTIGPLALLLGLIVVAIRSYRRAFG